MARLTGLADRFATNLVQERTKKKLSQEALAVRAGLSTSYISMLERGLRSPPLETVENLSKVLGQDPISMLR